MIRNGMPLSEIALNMAFVVVFYSVVFLLFYIISEHIIKNMIGGIILSILGAALAVVFPPLGILLAVIGILSIISKIISVIKMIPLLLLGVLFAVLLFADLLIAEFKFNEFYPFVRSVISISAFGFQFIFSKIMLGYLILSAITSCVLAFKYSLKNAMMRQVVIFMAIPITALIILLVHTLISNAFYHPQQVQQMEVHKNQIHIKDYFRADGTLVHAYWRRLPSKRGVL